MRLGLKKSYEQRDMIPIQNNTIYIHETDVLRYAVKRGFLLHVVCGVTQSFLNSALINDNYKDPIITTGAPNEEN